MSFLGPKPTQDPMNNVFEQKKSLGKIFFRDPRDPRPKNFSGPARAGGGPKGGPDRSVGVSNPSKTVGRPQKWFLKPNKHVKTFCLAKVMPKTRFFGLRWAFWPVLGAGWPNDYVVLVQTRKIPQNLKMRKKNL